MIVGYVGHSALSEIIIGRLSTSFELRRLPAAEASASQVKGCDVIVFAETPTSGIREFLSDCSAISRGLVVIDQTVADPEQTRAVAAELATVGVTLVDAPIQCEKLSAYPDASAILCGGEVSQVDRVRALLEAICPKVIHFGEVGTGHTARALVASVAASARMITYECAVVGFKNGLSVEDMANVLNRSSGQNSATERVLPFLANRERTSDETIAEVASHLRLTSHLAMRAGAPIVLPNLVADMCQSLAHQLGEGATVDDVVGLIEQAANVRFA